MIVNITMLRIKATLREGYTKFLLKEYYLEKVFLMLFYREKDNDVQSQFNSGQVVALSFTFPEDIKSITDDEIDFFFQDEEEELFEEVSRHQEEEEDHEEFRALFKKIILKIKEEDF